MEKGLVLALCLFALSGIVLADDEPTFIIFPGHPPAPQPTAAPAPAPAPAPTQNRNVKVTFRKRIVMYRHNGGNGK